MLAALAADVRSPRLAAAAKALEGLPKFRQEQLLRHVYPSRRDANSMRKNVDTNPQQSVLISQCTALPVPVREVLTGALGRDAWLSLELATLTGEASSQARKALFATLDASAARERVEAVHMAFRKPGEGIDRSGSKPRKASADRGNAKLGTTTTRGAADAVEIDSRDDNSAAAAALFGDETSNETLGVDAHAVASGHRSVCISSQAGCALACAFCATGRVGLKRQLTVDEITDQVLWWLHAGERVDTVSFMGMGEPLANPRTFDALRMLTHPSLFGFAPSRISVSTVGNVPAMRRLTTEFPRVNLAFSMHSPFPDQRTELVPNNKTHPLADCWEAVLDHVEKTRRKVFVAYLVLAGTNDSQEHAREVARWLEKAPKERRHLLHVNLLRYNPAHGIVDMWPRTPVSTALRFKSWLEEFGVASISTRQSFGVEEDAACGQLFASYEPKPVPTTKRKTDASVTV